MSGASRDRSCGAVNLQGRPPRPSPVDDKLRKALYFPAVVALNHNPPIQRFAARLKAAGKPTMVIIGAIMRKLLHLAYGILKSGKPFNPNYDTAKA